MSKSWNRPHVWLALAVGGVCAVVLLVTGMHVYMTATAVPIHPTPGDVPAAGRAAPARGWTAAVERGRGVLKTTLAERNLPGVSIAVGVAGELVWAEGFGWADIDERVAVTPDTRFRIGSASTVLTSAAAGRLLEQGRLSLDERIQTYTPEFPAKPWPITLRQVMAHQAGIRSDSGDESPLYGQSCERPAEALPVFAGKDLLFEPGTAYRYSAFGWIVVSAAIEKAAGKPFLDVMREQVFEPLGLHATGADTEPPIARAASYFPRYAADPRFGPDPMRELSLSCYAGAGVFVSTPSDLVRFAMALERGSFLKPDTVKLLQTSARLPSGAETGYGLGWDLETIELAGTPTRTIGHDGDLLGGPAVSLLTIPDRRLAVAVISNTSYADPAGIAARIAEAFAAGAAAGAK